MAANRDQDELHFEDEPPLATHPDLGRVWHRVGQQPVRPAAGPPRRLTVFGRGEARGRGRGAVLGAGADSAGFGRSLAALEGRHAATGRDVMLVFANGACHTSQVSQAALADRAAWLAVVPRSRSSPDRTPKAREGRTLKRDHRRHLAPTRRDFVPELSAGLGRRGGARREVVDEGPDWWVAGPRQEPTGRPPGRPKGAKAAVPRTRRTNLPAST